MATAEYIQNGEHIEFTAAADVAYMEVVPLAACVGVAETTLKTGETGTLSVRGVYALPAKSDLVIAQGETVHWNATTGQLEAKTATTITAGWAIDAKAASTTIAKVKIG